MNIVVSFEHPHTWWSVLLVFKKFYDWFEIEYPNHNISYDNIAGKKNGNPSGPYSPHLMIIKNVDNGKYIIVSYWDRAIELTWPGNGWDVNNRVELITSSGVYEEIDFTPFSYTTYSYEFEKIAKEKRIPYSEKENNSLLFRGYLYGERLIMSNYKPEYFTNGLKSIEGYFDELNNNKICISVNGVGEICNRDMEILSAGSVLLRPELSQKFHNNLIPNYHYISVEKTYDPIKQLDLILERYEEVKNDYDLLEYIANNGYEWYKNNGTIDSNVDILKKLIKIENLI